MEIKKQGVVIKGIGGNYDVACEGQILRCRASAKIKHQKNLLAAGATILSSYQYGTSLPSTATAGRLFFKKV